MNEFLNFSQNENDWEVAKKEADLEKPKIAAELLETEIPLSSETKADKLPVFSMPAIDKDYIEADVMADDILFVSGDQNLIENWLKMEKTATLEQIQALVGGGVEKGEVICR